MILFIFGLLLCVNGFGYKSKENVKQQIDYCLGQGSEVQSKKRFWNYKKSLGKVPVTTCQAECLSMDKAHDEIVANKMNSTDSTKRFCFFL